MQLTVRPELAADAPRVREVNLAAFGRPDEAGIVDAIRDTADWIPGGSLVAQHVDGQIVGHLLLSRGRLERDGDGVPAQIWMLGPLAVVPAAQRRGVGGALMLAATELAQARGVPLICLLGHADYYRRFGFEPARPLGIEPPADWSDDHWLALRLSNWRPELRGRAAYPPAFGVG